MSAKKLKLAVVVSHPIQHFCPQYVSFQKIENIDCKIFFASALGYKKYIDPAFKQEISWDNLHLDKFQHVFLNGEKVIPSNKRLDATDIEDKLEEFKPDVIITYGYWQKIQRRVYNWAVKNKVKLAYISDSELMHKSNFLKKIFKFFFLKKYFSLIDYFLSVGDSNEDFYKYYGVDVKQIIRMHFPIDIYLYEESYASRSLLRKEIRERYAIGEREIVASVVGKLVSWKRQASIIKAMSIMEKEGLYMHLFVIGSGDKLTALKKAAKTLITSKVHFTGFLSVNDLPHYYAASDFYVHPSSYEPHSIAISEAIYMGCPVIVSNTSGSYGRTDDVQENKNGFIFSLGKIDTLINAIRILSTDHELRKKFSDYSHKISKEFQQTAHFGVINQIRERVF